MKKSGLPEADLDEIRKLDGRASSREYAKRWQTKYPKRKRAHQLVAWALKWGKLKKPYHCERCGNFHQYFNGTSALIAHHSNYSKPLKVEWLCTSCHAIEHKQGCKPGACTWWKNMHAGRKFKKRD